jgi:hypothetical protein
MLIQAKEWMMRFQRIVFIGFGLVLSLGLLLMTAGVCKSPQPEETISKPPATEQAAPPATGASKKPSDKDKEASKAKPETPAKEASAPIKSGEPEKQPGKFVPSEGC